MMGFGGLIWIVIIIALVIWFVQYNKKGNNLFNSNREENSFDILNKRYANGEITKEEYDKMKKDISGKN